METFKAFVNSVFSGTPGAVRFLALAVLGFVLFVRFRRVATSVGCGAVVLALGTVFFALSLPDPHFREIVAKPDNVAIVGMVVLVAFFTWLGFRKAVRNDGRMLRGEPPVEKTEPVERVLCWPDLVYEELIALVLASVLFVVWAILVQAPLEQPADFTRTPNPSKAPWYFLGLQEMLVYFDPWLAGVVFPGLIIVGLMALPYLDRNPRGSGYYTFAQRPFAISIFSFGFLILWLLLIVMGTFLRGPNWNFFGPYEAWDVRKVEPLLNLNLSDWFWVRGLGSGPPDTPVLREAPGLVLLLLYFVALPRVLAGTVLRRFREQMGGVRYHIMTFLLLAMALLPIKMILRWTINLKYIISFPERFFSI